MTEAAQIIDALGGTTAVHKLTLVPISTIHSWRTIGIPRHRLTHIKLAAEAAGKAVPELLAEQLEKVAA
jgi:hypothetical protein